MKHINLLKAVICLILSVLFFAGCGSNETILYSSEYIMGGNSNETDSSSKQTDTVTDNSSVQKPTQGSSAPSSSDKTSSSSSQKKPENVNVFELVDFIVDVEGGRDAVVLQLTDPQIIDSSQKRSEDRIDSGSTSNWAPKNLEKHCFKYITEIVNATKPDLILLTGDVIYGEFDDSGAMLTKFINFMESFNIPWAPVMGNHDAETQKGIDWVCDQYEAAKNCKFKQRELTGNGNYTVGIRQNGKLKRVFFMLDSNGYSNMSPKTALNGHSVTTQGFGDDQIGWYSPLARQIKGASPDTKLSFAFHIQPYAFKEAFAKYGFTNSDTKNNPINIDTHSSKASTDFGYIGRDMKDPWDSYGTMWSGLKELGVDSVFVGHEHCNSASVMYDGIRCQYGQKSSTYDRFNVRKGDNTIIGSDVGSGSPIIGGTVIPVSSGTGDIIQPYIYYCKN